MDWPIDMPFPIFYQKWQVRKAKLLGVDRFMEKEGLPLNWETLRGLWKRAQQKPEWTLELLKEAVSGNQSKPAMIIEGLMAESECRTFILSADLIDALKQTDVKDVPQELVKVPFDLIYIDLSSSPVKINNNNPHTDSARGILVPGHASAIMAAMCQLSKKAVDNTIIGLIAEYAPGDTDGPEGHVCNWDCESIGWTAVDGVYPVTWEDGGVADMLEGRPELNEIWRLWVNALLYINSANADIREEWLYKKTAAKAKKAKGKRKRDMRQYVGSGGKVFRVGHYIHIPQISDGGETPNQGGKVGVRFMVRGHWHTYWTGSNRFGTKERKLKWLLPYWKGPEAADVVHGTYIVEGKGGY